MLAINNYLSAVYNYHLQQRELKARLDVLVLPEMEATIEAGTLVENLGVLWRSANLEERHRIVVGILDGVYVDMVQARKVVAIAPKPAFRRLFGIVTTRARSGVVVLNPKASPSPEPDEGDEDWLWWRRGRVELYREHGNSVLVAA